MPKFQYTEEEVPKFEVLKNGDYHFEVVGFATSLGKGKVNGCDVVELKVKWFADRTFSKPIAQWTEYLTFPQTQDKDLNRFLGGMLNMFAKCTGLSVEPGQELELNERTCLGLRGVAAVHRRTKKDKEGKPIGETNQVDRWLTDKEKFPKVVEVDDEEKPF